MDPILRHVNFCYTHSFYIMAARDVVSCADPRAVVLYINGHSHVV